MVEECKDSCSEVETSNSRKKALGLEYFTVGYNIGEGIISIIAGIFSGSVALVGFGLDSAIESLSGSVLIWRLLKHGRISEAEEARVEKKAVKLVGVSFLILAAYILATALYKLYTRAIPEPSFVGIAIAATSIIIMPFLGFAKLKAGKKMGLASLIADSKQTFICTFLSVALLIGLLLNHLYGLWWADPASALIMVIVIFREGINTLKEGKLCSC
jgi:divalent metal cation (Fe/Co/Zn/Cd) transporter